MAEMKLQFDNNLVYQLEAISSVVDLFKGQPLRQSNFTVTPSRGQIGIYDTDNGIGNRLGLSEIDILANLQEIQLRNGLPQTNKLDQDDYAFDIEMETGTGKTYVYLRTILELHKNYGFSKFIVVVPSIAIKEGVYKSLQITKDHFANLYDNTVYNYFIYDSSKLEQVRSFAVSDKIEIMIINIDAFKRSFVDPEKESIANIIHRPNDRLNGLKPIELIKETKPIVIIDEPQSVDNTDKAKEAISSLNPLCTLRYSATLIEKHHLVYKLDAIDSYNLELVKQVEVAGFEVVGYHNGAYIKLLSVNNTANSIKAKVEIDVLVKGSVKRKTVTIRQGDNLYDKSGMREIYEGFIVSELNCVQSDEYIAIDSQGIQIRLNESIGDIDEMVIKRYQIKKTIEEHLNKELILNKQGIKVLSLFFIDRVDKYKNYDDDGNPQKGIYAQLFEDYYSELMEDNKYKGLSNATPSDVHDGYFSIDKGRFKDTKGASEADDDTYNLIMKDKERLLSLDNDLRFIFSHSALREGWDNPNVFQICTLNETRSKVKKRQEIGRGLRLCVNQKGERQQGFSINILTVMANESYLSFAKSLQIEYEKDANIRFGVIEAHTFANIQVEQTDGTVGYLGEAISNEIHEHFINQSYIQRNGKIQNELKIAISTDKLSLPASAEHVRTEVISIVKKASSGINIRDNKERKTVSLNKQVFLDPEFKVLWDKIKHKTVYSVEFDSNELISSCIKKIQENLPDLQATLVYSRNRLIVGHGGIETVEAERGATQKYTLKNNLPDVITYLQNETNLTRASLAKILIESKSLDKFKENPQRYMEEVTKIIRSEMMHRVIDGIKYTKIGDDEFYAQELFETEELTGYLEKNMIESNKSVYQYVVYDSAVEESFASQFESNEIVKLYTKLPSWFKISTPLGSYNPDWAVLIEVRGERKLYFVIESKGSIDHYDLRPTESAKITCGRKHFEALNSGADFKVADNANSIFDNPI